jgi:hypothetical protein
LRTETRRAEVASAKPASLAASTHLLVTPLMSHCKEHAILLTLATCDNGRDGSRPPPILVCIKVAAAWSDAAIIVVCTVLGPCLSLLCVVKGVLWGGRAVLSMRTAAKGSLEDKRSEWITVELRLLVAWGYGDAHVDTRVWWSLWSVWT